MPSRDLCWAVDPAKGKPHAFAALDQAGTLVRSWTARNVSEACEGAGGRGLPDVIVVERPRIYPYGGKGRRSAPPNDILDLDWSAALLVGGLTAGGCAPYPRVVTYFPRDWKGQVAKPKHHRWLWLDLSPAERELLGGGASWAYIERACRDISLGLEPSYAWGMGDRLDAAALGKKYYADSRRKGARK